MKIKKPSIRELQRYLTSLKGEIQDDYIQDDGDTSPSMQITLACGPDGYGLQTGDNSYTGNAYRFPFWGIGSLYRNTDCTALARELIDQCLDLAYDA
jgi:hypothetical protein